MSRWFGATIYPATFGADFHQTVPCAWADPLFPQYIDRQLARAVEGGFNIIRCTDWLDRLPLTPGSGLAGPIPEKLWQNLDYLFDKAAPHGISICLDLSAFRNTLDGHQDRDGLKGYDPAKWTTFLPIVVNRYKDRKNLAYWSIGGEPRPPKEGGVSTAALTAFYKGVAAQIDKLSPSNRISTGGLSHINYDSGIDWKAIFALPHIDIVGIHRYSMGDETVSLPMVADWAKANNKPWLLEEFGFKQSDGDAQRATAFTRVAKLAISKGARGVMWWNCGPQHADGSYNIGPDSGTPLTWEAVKAVSKLP